MSEQGKGKNKKIDKVKYYALDDYSQEEFKALEKLYNESFKDIKEGEIIQGKIVGISDDNVVVDVGFKSDGTVPKNEFSATVSC